MFLYAYIVSDMILHDKLRITDTAAYPQSLNASFEAWFSRYFPDREEFDRRYKLPLGIIAVCREPVPVEELDRIHGRYDREEGCFQLAEADKNRRYQSAVKQLERCALLLKYGQNDFGKTTVAFTHRYITEWLTRTDAATGQSASRDYFCDPADLHWVLSRAWRNRLEAGTPLTEYQALHLLEAMQGAGEPEEVIREVAADEAWGKLLAEKLDACDREGRWKQSFLFAQAQLDRCLCAFGAEHPDTLTALNNLANAHHHLGRYQLALTLHERVCADRKRILGPEHPATLVAMSNLGVSYSNLGRYQDALSLDEQAYEISRRVLGEDHPDTLTYMNNLAQIHFHLGHAQQALLLQEINFEVRRRALGEDDPDTLTAMNNLALTYSALGRYQDALPLDGQLYEIRKRLLGPDHPDTLQSLKNLSYDCYQLGEYEKCVPLDELVIQITERLHGPQSQETAQALANQAMNYEKLKRYEDAARLQERAYALRRELLGEDDPATAKLRERVLLFREKASK